MRVTPNPFPPFQPNGTQPKPAGPNEAWFLHQLKQMLGSDMDGDVIDLRGHPKAQAFFNLNVQDNPLYLEYLRRMAQEQSDPWGIGPRGKQLAKAQAKRK